MSQPSRSGLKNVCMRSLPSSSGILKGSVLMLSYRLCGRTASVREADGRSYMRTIRNILEMDTKNMEYSSTGHRKYGIIFNWTRKISYILNMENKSQDRKALPSATARAPVAIRVTQGRGSSPRAALWAGRPRCRCRGSWRWTARWSACPWRPGCAATCSAWWSRTTARSTCRGSWRWPGWARSSGGRTSPSCGRSSAPPPAGGSSTGIVCGENGGQAGAQLGQRPRYTPRVNSDARAARTVRDQFTWDWEPRLKYII